METQRPEEDAETNAEDVALNADQRNDRQVERLRAGVSGRTLQRRLTENGRKFKTMVVEVRIEQAREHLLDPSLSITEIAKRLGYGDVSSFDHAFCRSAGVSPRQWRALNKPGS